jgi:hypothetical protein
LASEDAPSYADKKDPKLSLSELLSWITIFKSIHMAKTIEKRRKKHVRLTYQTKYLQIQREFGRVALP